MVRSLEDHGDASGDPLVCASFLSGALRQILLDGHPFPRCASVHC